MSQKDFRILQPGRRWKPTRPSTGFQMDDMRSVQPPLKAWCVTTVANDRYAVRDLSTKDEAVYKGWMSKIEESSDGRAVFVPKPRAAWLYLDQNDGFMADEMAHVPSSALLDDHVAGTTESLKGAG